MHGLHNDPKSYIGALEDPKRDAYQKPHEVLAALNLKPAKSSPTSAPVRAISLSAYRTLSAPKGKVYAVDVSPDMIRHINRRIRDLKATNVVSDPRRSR